MIKRLKYWWKNFQYWRWPRKKKTMDVNNEEPFVPKVVQKALQNLHELNRRKMSKTYRQLLLEKYPDRREEIEAIDYSGLDMIKNARADRCDDWYFLLLASCEYYQRKLEECEKMYQNDVIQY